MLTTMKKMYNWFFYKKNNNICKIQPLNSDIECAICLESCIFDSKNVCKTCCNHYYHSECLEKSVKIINTCPICRSKLSSSSNTTNDTEPVKCPNTTRFFFSIIILYLLLPVIIIYIIISPIIDLFY